MDYSRALAFIATRRRGFSLEKSLPCYRGLGTLKVLSVGVMFYNEDFFLIMCEKGVRVYV